METTSPTPVSMSWLFAKDVVGGTVGGCMGIVVGQPLDTVKVRLQSTAKYTGIWNCVTRTVLALYKGMAAPLISNAPINAAAFGAYGVANRFIHYAAPEYQNTMSAAMAAGCFCGFVQAFIMTPSELIKCRLQVQSAGAPKLYNGVRDCIVKSVKAKGLVKGLYTGWLITNIRDVPAFGAYFAAYEWTKYTLAKYQGEETPGTVTLLIAGANAGIFGWVSTYPADVLKSVQQTLPDSTPREETKLWYLTKKLLKQHGPMYFTRGLGSTIIRAIPVNAVTFLGYEEIMKFMEKSRQAWLE